MVEIVNGGSVINGEYPVWFLPVHKQCFFCVYWFVGGGRVGGEGVLRYFF